MKKCIILLLTISTFQINAQRTITGTVKFTDGELFAGVAIVIKGRLECNLTDWDGQYNIKINEKDSILIYSFPGCKTKKIFIGKSDTLHVVLEEKPVDESYFHNKRLVGTGCIRYWEYIIPDTTLRH